MTDPVVAYERKFSGYAVAAAGVWLAFLAPAVAEGWRGRETGVGWAGLLLTVAFGATYLGAFVWGRPMRRTGLLWREVAPAAVAFVLGLVLLAAAMCLTLGSYGLDATVYIGVAAMILLPTRWALPVCAGLVVTAEGLARLVPGWDRAAGVGLSVVLSSFATWGVRQLMRRNVELIRMREENARLAVEEERNRVGRDLHDILGHSLTVITLKAELASRLIGSDAQRAGAEVADIERLSRDALADVRRTAHGYRGLSLAAEIARARTALAAAQIDAHLPNATDEVPTGSRELFAWAVREGVTNVVRHSGATNCSVALEADRVRIVDDGRGCPHELGAVPGNGIAGLRERAAAVGARVVTESTPPRGFTLSVVTGGTR